MKPRQTAKKPRPQRRPARQPRPSPAPIKVKRVPLQRATGPRDTAIVKVES